MKATSAKNHYRRESSLHLPVTIGLKGRPQFILCGHSITTKPIWWPFAK